MPSRESGEKRGQSSSPDTQHWTHHSSNVGSLSVDDPASYASKKRLMRDVEEGEVEEVSDAPTKKPVVAKTQTVIQRLDHLTWAWFTLPMSMGGIALLLGNQPHTFRGLQTIGKVVFIFDLVIFVSLVTLISTRFIRGGRGRLISSLTNPAESFFFPTILLSLASIIPSIYLYGRDSCGPWLATAVLVLFWIYVASGLSVAIFQYGLLFSGVQLTIHSMTPAWLLPIFPAMLSGTVAGTVASAVKSTPSQALPVVVAGLSLQGLGFFTAIIIFALYISRLMQSGFPAPDLRPGMFIAVGPTGFTGTALIELSMAVPRNYSYLATYPDQAQVLQTIALCFSILIWGIGFFFWGIALLAVLLGVRKMSFHLIWYAFIFPNVGFILATIKIGQQLQSQGIQWVGSVATIVLITVYLCVLAAHVRAVWKREILWAGRDEDRDS